MVNCAGQWAKQVGAVVRGDRAAALLRALLRGDRADRRGAPRPAGAAGPGRLHLFQGGGGRPGGGRVRAQGQAVGGARRAALPVRVPAAARGLGPLLGADGRTRCCGSRRCTTPGSRSSTTGRRASPRTTSSSSARPRSAGTSSSRRASTRSASPRAGGAGRALAEWILSGDPGLDLTANDIRRFARFNGNNRWLRDRVGEILGLHYALPWPNRELATARPFRRSPGAPPAGGRRMPASAAGWAGSGPTSSPRPGRSRSSSTPGGRRTGCPGCAAEQRAARTRRGGVRPDLVLQVPAHRAGQRGRRCSGCAPPTSRSRPAGRSTPGC